MALGIGRCLPQLQSLPTRVLALPKAAKAVFKATPSAVWLMLALLAPLTLMAAFRLVALPAVFSDFTAIFGFHGKVLSCECLFDSHLIKERVWTGTHPEYPLFIPFMHAYFFTLMDSFRDDLVNIYQSISVLACTWLIAKTLRERFRSPAAAIAAALLFLSVISGQPWNDQTGQQWNIVDAGSAELNSVIFVTVVALALLSEDSPRLWLYLFALAFTKREALVETLVLSGLMAGLLAMPLQRRRVLPELWSKRQYLLPFLPVYGWLAVAKALPSFHEQYERHLFSSEAWTNGFGKAIDVMQGCLDIMLRTPLWTTLLVALPIATMIALGLFLRRPEAGHRFLALLCVWTCSMYGVFWIIYIVSPWGVKLNGGTWVRLLQQITMPLVLALAVMLSKLNAAKSFKMKVVALAVCTALMGLVTPSLIEENVVFWRRYKPQLVSGRIGLAAFRDATQQRRAALILDAELPAAASGAMLGDTWYFDINYLLYPRRFYPLAPDVVAGTWQAWRAWDHVSQADMQRYGFQFVVRNWQVQK